MKIKTLVDEDIVNYKKASMFIGLGSCNWKCCKEAGIPTTVCQNSELAKLPDIEISAEEIFRRYKTNTLTEAIVIGGLEPLTIVGEILNLLSEFRYSGCDDDIVIYTGYTEIEQPYIDFASAVKARGYKNIYAKVGRYIPDHEPHYDSVLGVKLASDNQKGIQVCGG